VKPAKPASVPSMGPAAIVSQRLTAVHAMELARKFLADLNQGKTADLWQRMTPAMQGVLKDLRDWQATEARFKAEVGEEAGVENERVVPGVRVQVYTRLSAFTAVSPKVITMLALNDQGQIAAYTAQPAPDAAETRYLDYKDKTRFVWPLKGDWLVYQGGRSTYDNYHAAYRDQRFAYDMIAVSQDKLCSGDGERLEEFYAFGQPVLASADGTVDWTADLFDDNPVKKPSSLSPIQGNNVVIDHGNGEFSMLAHLKRGSVKVKTGDKVKAGQEIAQCGNSGNSPFPHLHYHLQTTPNWFKGDGLPIQFHDYIVDGKPVASGEPVRGQVVKTP